MNEFANSTNHGFAHIFEDTHHDPEGILNFHIFQTLTSEEFLNASEKFAAVTRFESELDILWALDFTYSQAIEVFREDAIYSNPSEDLNLQTILRATSSVLLNLTNAYYTLKQHARLALAKGKDRSFADEFASYLDELEKFNPALTILRSLRGIIVHRSFPEMTGNIYEDENRRKIEVWLKKAELLQWSTRKERPLLEIACASYPELVDVRMLLDTLKAAIASTQAKFHSLVLDKYYDAACELDEISRNLPRRPKSIIGLMEYNRQPDGKGIELNYRLLPSKQLERILANRTQMRD